MDQVFVTGHRNPDTDSIVSAMSYTALQNALGERGYTAARLGHLNDESKRVLERFGFVTVVECHLETGRTHQIRVHMNSLGHPLFNDAKYGGSDIRSGTIYAKYKQFIRNCFEICPRQALHAKTLGFVHPRTGKEVRFDSPLPADMTALLDKWRRYAYDMPEEEE